MQIQIDDQGAFASARVLLDSGETFQSESGAMFRTSDSISVDVTTRTRGGGGILRGLGRMLAGDSFFLSTYESREDRSEVGLAPTLPGDVAIIELDGTEEIQCAGGAYLASGPDIDLTTRFQGFKGLFSGESLFFVEATGRGPLVVTSFGRIEERRCEGELVVDSGHVVAFDNTIQYRITKAGRSMIQSFLGGEGFVMRFEGEGRIWTQSHSPKEYGREVGRRLPARRK